MSASLISARSAQTSNFHKLPTDALRLIGTFLTPNDTVNVRTTCNDLSLRITNQYLESIRALISAAHETAYLKAMRDMIRSQRSD